MRQENLIKISTFQRDTDGGLLLISEADGLPFLEVDAEGVSFDAGPFTGFFCELEGLSKFTVVKHGTNTACSVQLKFAEGDVYPIGGFHFSDSQYSEGLHWVMTANKKIREKKGDKGEPPIGLSEAVIGMIAEHVGVAKECLKPHTSISAPLLLNSLSTEVLVLKAEERFQIVVPNNIVARIRTIADVIGYVNAQVEDKLDFA